MQTTPLLFRRGANTFEVGFSNLNRQKTYQKPHFADSASAVCGAGAADPIDAIKLYSKVRVSSESALKISSQKTQKCGLYRGKDMQTNADRVIPEASLTFDN